MRSIHRGMSAGLLMSIIVSVLSSGCVFDFASSCDRNPNLACYWELRGYDVGTAGGGGGGTPAKCVPSENNTPVAEGCGVFVSSSLGDDANAGTKNAPLKTLQQALNKASGRPVYACAEEFAGSVTLVNALAIYGGLDCSAEWAFVGATKKTLLRGDADTVALTLTKEAVGAEFNDFAITAADGVKEGGSSIAVIADGATAEFVRCELTSGNGANGVAGTPGDPNGSSATAGVAGNSGKDACSDLDGTPGPDLTLSGGAAAVNTCQGDVSVGGIGGNGNELFGGGGDVGQTGSAGKAGTGEPAAGMWSCIEGGGLIGSPGDAGTPGAGATSLGAINAFGFTSTSGGTGTSGKAGQGGGGGGGAKGGLICPGSVSGSGASGGSGGSGGCGGLPGTGGGPGGGSIALVSLKASITLTDSNLLTNKGGEGGPGGDAQAGGPGGDAGKGGQGAGLSNAACSGGQGGKGGNGGPGGGGLGGPSIGVAFTGSPVTKQGKTTITPGSPGAGGKGGSANVAMNAGAIGAVGEEQLFPE